MKPKPQASPSIWDSLDQIRAAAHLDTADIPPGAVSTDEYAARYGVSAATARRQLLEMEKAGTLKCGCSIERGKRIKRYWP